jgi:maltooligosyltrehalose trehalohydrolase
LTDTFVYDGAYSEHRRRAHGRPAANVPSHHFLGYLQTHDQVGNRARGERISHLTSWGRAKIGAALYLAAPFIPMLFQGEEFAASAPFQYFTHHEEEALAQAVSEGRKREFAAFGWKPEDVPDPQDPQTFLRSKLNWSELELAPHREMLAWYRSLIHLRHSTPALSSDRGNHTSVHSGGDWIHLIRGPVHVFCNLSSKTLRLPLVLPMRLLIASDEAVSIQQQCVVLSPESVVICSATDQPNP